MNKIIFTVLMVSLLVISVTGCADTDDKAPDTADEAVSPSGSEPLSTNETPSSMEVITLDRAKEIALAHSGLEETDVTFVNAKLDTDDGKQEYEIEFYSGNTEYDYDIDPSTGNILSYDSDVENYSSSGSVQSDNNNTYIGEEKAKSIALEKVPGATESDIRLSLDSEDRRAVYEGSILFDDMEYEFEIDAATGTIENWSAESINDE